MTLQQRVYRFACLLLIVPCIVAVGPLVFTRKGLIQGESYTGIENRTIHVFHSIPYAKSPVKELRFMAPQPLPPWGGVLKADREDPKPCLLNYYNNSLSSKGNEDCLYLSIFTSNIPYHCSYPSVENCYHQLSPVIVFLDENGLSEQFAFADRRGENYLLNDEFVLVKFNYRSGVLGFMSSDDDLIPGNAGLKDQVAVLQWVRDNIEAFGGDMSRVTLFGVGRAAGMVHHHMISTTSRGLFHRAIVDRMDRLSYWGATKLGSKKVLQLQARFTKCSGRNVTSNTQCLKSVDAIALIDAADEFWHEFQVHPYLVYQPTIEKARQRKAGEKRFYTMSPSKLLRRHGMAAVPLLQGLELTEDGASARGVLINKCLAGARSRLKLGPITLDVAESKSAWRRDLQSTVRWQNTVDLFFPRDRFNNEHYLQLVKYFPMLRLRSHQLISPLLVDEHTFSTTVRSLNRVILNKTVGRTFGTLSVAHCDDEPNICNSKMVILVSFKSHLDVGNGDKTGYPIQFKVWSNFAKHGNEWTDTNKSFPSLEMMYDGMALLLVHRMGTPDVHAAVADSKLAPFDLGSRKNKMIRTQTKGGIDTSLLVVLLIVMALVVGIYIDKISKVLLLALIQLMIYLSENARFTVALLTQ